MRLFLIFCVAVVVSIIVGIGAYLQFGLPAYSWHQKLTITVEADGKTYSGSSVARVRFRKNDPLGSVNGPEWITSIRGEAPFVEIPGRGVLFALLNPPGDYIYSTDIAFEAFSQELPVGSFEQKLKFLETDPGLTVVLPANLRPYFVMFGNISDPATVHEVDANNLAEFFGPGTRLIDVTLEMTNEPISDGVISEFGFMKVLQTQSTLSGLQAYNEKYPDPIYYLTSKAFKLGK